MERGFAKDPFLLRKLVAQSPSPIWMGSWDETLGDVEVGRDDGMGPLQRDIEQREAYSSGNAKTRLADVL